MVEFTFLLQKHIAICKQYHHKLKIYIYGLFGIDRKTHTFDLKKIYIYL